MTMPTIENSCTLNDFKNMYNPDPRIENTVTKESLYEAYVYAIAQLIRLFIEIHVIHFDLHDNNVLVYYHRNILKCMLIDFGEACDLDNEMDNKYIKTSGERNFYLNNAKKYLNNAEKYKKFKLENSDVKNTFVEKILKLLIDADTKISFGRKGIDKSKGNVLQMDWITDLDPHWYYHVFDTLTKLMPHSKSEPSGLSEETIRYLKETNALISFDNPDGSKKIPPDFYERISSNDETIEDCSETNSKTLCTISGGKHKKSRKNKKQNKNYTPKNKSRKISNKNYL